ncbi:hypothetical protein BDN70DRAFT_939309 [Pholiota conissans]|uniref:Uncharacterized protein n=1 Tax=Pholiota conissans TaxID=109636 RepID=A0A9P6CLB7_9AGAR|nr:hypothetical protein BDN70DRAFT_939309 [Pholiota conissans]
MVNPGAFPGTRKDFLTAQKAIYAEAVMGNHVADTVADIQRCYFKRYPISLAHTAEPTAAWLAQVDDSGPDLDLLPPDQTLLDEDAFKAAEVVYSDQVKLLKFRKEQIARRLAYQHAKDANPTKHISVGSEDPMAVLMSKLAGTPLKKPHMRTAYNVWSQRNRETVEAVYEERIRVGHVPRTKKMSVRTQVYKECFDKLDLEVKKTYERMAAEEHRLTIENMELALNSPPSQSPADRQQVLRGLPTFVQPILDLISNYTGWKATLLVGGPEPADQGRLNMMSFHAGETIGNVKMNFGRSERRGYKNFVMPIFGSFLKKCYTVEDCRAAALSDSTTASLAEVLQLDGGDSYNVESVDSAISLIRATRTPSGENGRELATSGLSPSTITQSAARFKPSSQTSRSTMLHATTPTQKSVQDEARNHGVKTNDSAAPSPVPSPRASPSPSSRTSLESTSAPLVLAPIVLMTVASASLPTASPDEIGQKRPQKRSLNKGESDVEGANADTPLRKRLRSSKVVDVDMPTRSTNVAKHVSRQASPLSAGSCLPSNSLLNPPLTAAELAQTPDWFLKVYQMFLSKDLGPSWLCLVRLWAQFEKDSQYEEEEKLGVAARPPCIKAWIARARSPTYKPDLGALPLFEKSFRAWWTGLQPEWQLEGADGVLKQQQGDLDCLRRPGKNGLVSVIAALFFWAAYAEEKGCTGWKQAWKASVGDVYWVVQNLNSP